MNRTMMIAALALLAAPAAAQDGIRAQLGSCLAIPGVLQRLACYDSVAKGNGITTPARAPVAAAPMAAPMPPRTALNAAQAPRATSATEGFGAERLPQAQAARRAVEEITSPITDLTYSITGKFTVTLANGQQKEGDVAAKFYRKSDQTATISRGTLGSYNMVINGSGAYYKVSRVR
jgi:hypothetical protein